MLAPRAISRVVLCLLIPLGFAANVSSQEDTNSSTSSEASAEVEIRSQLRRYVEFFNARKFDQLAELLSPELVYLEQATGIQAEGVDSFLKRLKDTTAAEPTLTLFADGDEVVSQDETTAVISGSSKLVSDNVPDEAVNKDGIVSGNLHNRETDQTQVIQGRVDNETQRVAMRIGESEDVVAETGLYNLTQDEASVLVHFGSDTQDTYLLVRLPSPEGPATED